MLYEICVSYSRREELQIIRNMIKIHFYLT